jgi:hypothetical protein
VSQIENVITTTFRARGNQAIASMGQIAQGFGNVGRVINENTRLSDRLNAQWRALGTTIRYSLAGGAVFGLTRLVGQLRDVQQQAGLISAIGQQPGGLFGRALNDPQVTTMMNNLRNSAVQALTPVQEMNDAATNFLSTVQNVNPTEVPGIITALGRAAKLSQTPVDDLTKSVTSMNVAFGRQNNLPNIQAFSRMWFALISTIPGGPAAGGEISNQLPQLASMFMLGRGRNVTPAQGQAQMLSLVMGALRTGATPATGMRGLTYLLQSIAQPTGGARKALAGIGITPQFVEQNGIFAALNRLLAQVSRPSRGTVRQLSGMSDDALSQLDENGGALPGISAAEMTRLRAMVPRIHGIRTAIILASQMQQHGDVSSLPQDLALMNSAQNDQIQGALNMAQAWQRFRNRARLQEAVTAIDAMRLQVAQTFEPILNFAAGRISGAQSAMAHHPRATRDVILGGAAFLGALGIGRAVGAGRWPGLNKIPGLRSLLGGGGRGFVMAEAATAALGGNSALGASPQNPLYVIVVGQIFGGGTRGPGGGGGGLDPTNPVNDYFGYKALRAGGRLGKRAGGVLARYGRRALGLAESGAPRYSSYLDEPGMLSRFGGKVLGPVGIALSELAFPSNAGGSEGNYIGNLNMLRRTYGRNVGAFENPRTVRINGRAEVALTLDMVGPGGKTVRKRVHVPMDLWSGGRTPSSGGKPATRRH